MGWNIDLTTDKPMTESTVEDVIADLPESLRAWGGRQQWGWSLAVDVRFDSPQKIGLAGSYVQSGQIAEFFAEAFSRRLEKRGFVVTISKMRG